MVTRSVAVVPAIVVAIVAHGHLDSLDEWLNVLQSVQLPFALLPVLLFTSGKRERGRGGERERERERRAERGRITSCFPTKTGRVECGEGRKGRWRALMSFTNILFSFPLLYSYTTEMDVMGSFVNKKWVKISVSALSLFVIAVNVYSVIVFVVSAVSGVTTYVVLSIGGALYSSFLISFSSFILSSSYTFVFIIFDCGRYSCFGKY